jgi:hypothetical protein
VSATESITLTAKHAWWLKPALYLAWPIALFSEWQAERYMNWIALKGIRFDVR